MSAGSSDATLAARAAAGDDLAFGVLVARHRPALLRAATARLGPFGAEAEDVVQDALGRAHADLRRRGAPANVVAWLHVIVRNRALDVIRHHPSRRGVPLDDHDGATESPDAVVARREQVDAVMTAIGGLPGRQRDALIDVVFSGATYEQVAATQATSVSAVKALVNRARRTVRAAAAAVLPLPGLVRDRLWLLTAHNGDPSAAIGLVKGCAVVGAIATFSLTVAPDVRLPVHPPVPGPRHHAPRLDRSQMAAVAVHAATRPPARAGLTTTSTHRTPAATARDAIAACSSGDPLPAMSTSALRRTLRNLPDDVAEYTPCQAQLRTALRSVT